MSTDATLRQRAALRRMNATAPPLPHGLAVVEEVMSVIGIIALPFVMAALAAGFAGWVR